RLITPEDFGEAAHRDEAARLHGQNREQTALLPPTQRYRRTVDADVDRAQYQQFQVVPAAFTLAAAGGHPGDHRGDRTGRPGSQGLEVELLDARGRFGAE